MTRIALAVFVIVIAGVVGFVLFIPHANRTAEMGPVATSTAEILPLVKLSDSYKKGTHTISGSLIAPNPCTSVSAEAFVEPGESSSTPATILVSIAMPHDVGVCLQQETLANFSVSAKADGNALIVAEVNGARASTTSP